MPYATTHDRHLGNVRIRRHEGAVITALKNDGVTKFADLDGLSVERGRGATPGR